MAQYNMAGVGYCRAVTTLLSIILTLLPVSQSESFRDSPASLTALTHAPLNLTCYVPDPSPPPLVEWLVNNSLFQENDDRRRAVYDNATGRSVYRFSEVEYSDAGQYRCIALSETGTELFQSDTGTLTVQGQPTFRQSLVPVVTPLGSQAVFQCLVTSNPPANVSWTFGHSQQNLSSGGRIFLNSSVLIISNVQSSDEDYYHCIAVNAFGINSTSASLSIGERPPPLELTIDPPERPLQVREGSDITLHCTVNDGATVDTLQWYFNGEEVTEHITRESSGLALSLESIAVEHEGEYRCVATTVGASTVTQTVQLEVLIPPTVELVPDTSPVVVVNHILNPIPRCNARGIPEPTVTWLGPGGEPLVVEDGVPVFGPLSRSSTGVYVCVGINTEGEDRAELSLVVEDSPIISLPPSDTLASYGSDVTLSCVAEGPPSPIISWSLGNGGQLGNSSVEVTGALHLFSVSEEDSGVYVCEASNGYNPPTSASATLTVLSPPAVTSIEVLPSSIIPSGTDFSVLCSVSVPPVPFSIHWYRNGTLLVPSVDPRIQLATETGRGTLTVYGPDESYSGVYRCDVSTSYAFDTAQVSITVGAAPVITVAPSDVDLKPGEGASIDCAVTGSPNPRIEWFVTDEMVPTRQLTTTVGEHYIIHTDRLELRNVTSLESGVYECRAENELGRVVRTATVRVEGMPLALSFSPTTLIAGDNYTLTCVVIDNFPTATIIWQRLNGPPLSGERFTTTPSGVLEISPVVPTDGGFYECIAVNEYGDTSVGMAVTVHVRPTVTIPSPQLIAIFFDDVTLSCSVDGSPAPSQQWTRNGRSLTGSRYEVVGSDLVISTVRVTDTGNYTCMASNEVGVASAVLEVLVRGAPVTNLTAVTLNSTSISISWSPPPPLLTPTLSTYYIQYGFSGSRERETLQVEMSVTFVLFAGLEEDEDYQFSVYGDYGDVLGVEVTVTAATHEDIPTAAPQNISLDGEVEALDISWLAPPKTERNGVIVRYDIYYRKTKVEEGANMTLDPFIKANHTPFNLSAESHWVRLGGLEGGRRYEVMISAATRVGVGPNSTLVTTETLEPFPLLLVLAITIPATTILLLLCLLVALCVCYRCCSRRSRVGKHSPLVEEAAYSHRQRKRRGRGGERIISGPVPEVPPNIEMTAGKFAMRTQQGQLLSSEPKVIMPEDVAPPPQEGGVVQQVPYDEVLTSLKRKEDDPYEEVTVDGPPILPYTKSNPLYKPDPQDGAEMQFDPFHNRLTQSDDLVAPYGNQVDYDPNLDVSIELQGGSLPHVAHTGHHPVTDTGLKDKSQSLDLSAPMWSGLPLIREAEVEHSDNSEDERHSGEEEGEGERGEEGGEERVVWGERGREMVHKRYSEEEEGERGKEGGEEREGEMVHESQEVWATEEEREDWIQPQGEGWKVPLIHEGGGGEERWGEGAAGEIEEEREEGEGEGKRRRVTNEGWEERYVGEEGEEEVDITPAPNEQQPEDELRASSNSLDLASQEAEPVAPEAEEDTQHLYATVPATHKAKKRMKMMKEAQKREQKARKQKRKMEERAEKEQRKEREKERKTREKERKSARLRDEMGLGNIMRMQDGDTGHRGRAQAHFIDAATAPLF